MKRTYIAIIAAVIIIVVGFVAWRLGHDSGQKSAQQNKPSSGENTQSSESNNDGQSSTSKSAVKDLATYTVPDGWSETSCSAKPEVIYLVPPDMSVNCDADPSAPLSLSVDPNRTLSCGALQSNQNVRKHVCKSQDINGQKSLQASTEYLESSDVAPGLTVSDYYVPAGKQVIKVEYRYSGTAQYQAQFDQLAQSVKPKS